MITGSIVTYRNDPQILSRAIDSYLSSSNNSKLYVVDNSPREDAKSLCDHPSIEYINNKSNVGYGRAHNSAISKSLNESKYHLVLNPDVSFEPTVIPELLRFLEENEDVGLVMPRVVYPDGEPQWLCKLLPTPYQLFARRFLKPLKKTVERICHEYEMRFTGYASIVDAPSLSGCFMLIRTDVLKEVGLFDERFFLYFEDTDLSRRINKVVRTVYYPHVTIRHVHRHDLLQRTNRLFHILISGFRYFNKWGWFVDEDRDKINHAILRKFRVNGYAKQKI